MKKIITLLVVASSILACQKETSKPNTTTNNTTNTNNSSDTTKNTTTNIALITGLVCDSIKISGTLTVNQEANNVTATVGYIGGNGKEYTTDTYTSTGVLGLTATLQSGTLSNGKGILTYTISGIPSSIGIAKFTINFGGKNCILYFKVKDLVKIIGIPGDNLSDIDGNIYKTVKIGTQTWMAENLKVTRYNDGTEIQKNLEYKTSDGWHLSIKGGWVYYKNDAQYNNKYGKLYNGFIIKDSLNGYKNVCPTGWHLPATSEWNVLIDFLGGSNIAGNSLKEDGNSHWLTLNVDANNSSLFTALPAGRDDGGLGSITNWWSTTNRNNTKNYSEIIYLGESNGQVQIVALPKGMGCSIRCLKD